MRVCAGPDGDQLHVAVGDGVEAVADLQTGDPEPAHGGDRAGVVAVATDTDDAVLHTDEEVRASEPDPDDRGDDADGREPTTGLKTRLQLAQAHEAEHDADDSGRSDEAEQAADERRDGEVVRPELRRPGYLQGCRGPKHEWRWRHGRSRRSRRSRRRRYRSSGR